MYSYEVSEEGIVDLMINDVIEIANVSMKENRSRYIRDRYTDIPRERGGGRERGRGRERERERERETANACKKTYADPEESADGVNILLRHRQLTILKRRINLAVLDEAKVAKGAHV